MSMLRPLTLHQWGLETNATHGTAVAATSKIAVADVVWTPIDEMYRPNLARGLILPHSGQETPVRRGSTFKVTDQPVVFDQLQHWCAMAIAGNVSGVLTGGDHYLYTFTRNPAADPDPDSFTFERRLSDGTNFVDLEWRYCMLSMLGFSFEQGQALKFSAEGFARRVQSSTLTASLPFPSTNIANIQAAPGGTLSIDSTWATIGTTLISGQVRSAKFNFKTGLKPVILIDGRTDLDFSQHVVDGNEVGMTLDIEVLLTKAQFDAQKTAAEAGTLRAVRLELAQESTRNIQIDGLFKFEAASFFEVGDADGQVAGTFKLVESTDGTNLLRIKVNNTAADYT